MEFKKKQPKPYEDPMDICKRLFKKGVIFNNGKIIKQRQKDVTIDSVIRFRGDINNMSMDFRILGKDNEFTFTVCRNGIYADIIP